ncbi:hypothetical protein M9X92_011660 [Pyricularia oryzae]|nr:hypothetical protein M9X92_011660 [Pyricularia oryzae]
MSTMNSFAVSRGYKDPMRRSITIVPNSQCQGEKRIPTPYPFSGMSAQLNKHRHWQRIKNHAHWRVRKLRLAATITKPIEVEFSSLSLQGSTATETITPAMEVD